MKRILAFVVSLLAASVVHAQDWQESAAVKEQFEKAGVQGTFVLYDVGANTLTGFDRARAERRYEPASTYKIPNSLIGLTVGAVKNVDEVVPYGGKPQRFKTWEKDMPMREAIKASSVPIYQEIARRIGLDRMQSNLNKIGYGNNQIGSVVDNFWLVGPLKISAVEQTKFLTRLAHQELPFPKEVQASVHEIIQLESVPNWTLYGKTGWVMDQTPDIGWWVGWVKKGDRLYSFALNIDMPNDSYAAKRIEVGKACLKALGIL